MSALVILSVAMIVMASCGDADETGGAATIAESTTTTSASTTTSTRDPHVFEGAPMLPPPSIQPRQLEYGDTIAVSIDGCVDPSTGSSDGLAVWMAQGETRGGGAPTLQLAQAVPVDANGRLSTTFVVGEVEPKDYDVWTYCARSGTPPPVVQYEPVTVTVRSNKRGLELSPAQVRAGESVEWRVPCTPDQYGTSRIEFTGSVPTGFPGIPAAAGTVEGGDDDGGTITVPSDATPDDYQAWATCSTHRVGVDTWFAPVTLTVVAS